MGLTQQFEKQHDQWPQEKWAPVKRAPVPAKHSGGPVSQGEKVLLHTGTSQVGTTRFSRSRFVFVLSSGVGPCPLSGAPLELALGTELPDFAVDGIFLWFPSLGRIPHSVDSRRLSAILTIALRRLCAILL